MVQIGKTYTLDVVKQVDFGFYVDAEDLGEVLIPLRYAPKDLTVGDKIEVFLYHDSQGRPVATTKKPKGCVGKFVFLKVLANTDIGSFLEWGLAKDVLAPFAEQYEPMEVGKYYLVYLYLDKIHGRITASSRLNRFIDDEKPHEYKLQQEVDLIIANTTELGHKAIINHTHWGVLYKNEVHQKLTYGQSIKGYIKKIRSDGKIDLSLHGGQVTYDNNEKIILNYLKKQNGFSPVHDKSDPRVISELFGMSKRLFKRAIGNLYKQGLVSIEKEGVRLVEKD